VLGGDWQPHQAAFGLFVTDGFAAFIKLLLLAGLLVSLVLSMRYLEQEKMGRIEYPVLMLFSGLGMMLMVSASSLLSLYAALELQSLSLYVLASIRRDHERSAEAGMKYFVLGAIASGMLLFGASLVYGFTGSISFSGIAAALSNPGALTSMHGTGVVVGLVFLLTGLAFKISSVPFHMWTPDVYEGAPTSVTAFFAIVPKTAAMALMIRLLFGPFGSLVPEWQQIVWFLSAASMTLGAFAALLQNNIKRLMAYSTISNMGFALVGLAAGTEAGVSAVIFYLAVYMVMAAGTFGVILMMRKGGAEVETLQDLAGLSRTRPALAHAMAILMFSLSGVPPLAGFFGKLLVFEAAIAQNLVVLAVLGLLSSVVAAFYYLRIIKIMFFDEGVDALDPEIGYARNGIIALSVLFVVLFAFAPQVLVDACRGAAASLFS
jgi:NADH-quinone oxidoreductase subunit N